jgi:hypothetical protein
MILEDFKWEACSIINSETVSLAGGKENQFGLGMGLARKLLFGPTLLPSMQQCTYNIYDSLDINTISGSTYQENERFLESSSRGPQKAAITDVHDDQLVDTLTPQPHHFTTTL